MMQTRNFWAIGAAVLPLALLHVGAASLHGQTAAPASLSGRVSSAEEGSMEGVLVRAKKAGSTITVTVVTDQQGRYSFPRARVEPGRYSLRIRAAGYDLEDPGPVEVTAGSATQLDLKLRKTLDLAAQLSNAEWFMSMPGTREQKAPMYVACVRCHSLERVLRSRHSADEWMQVLARMNYFVGSTPLKPQRRPAPTAEERAHLQLQTQERNRRRGIQPQATPQGGAGGDMGGGEGGYAGGGQARRALAEYLATVNLSQGPSWSYQLKTLPRPKGRGTRVIITEYELPRRETMVHDADYGPDGFLWYADFGSQFVGKLDPKTGQVVEYPVPVLKPGYPQGMLDVRFDKEGNVWFGMMAQGGIAKFDRKTQKLQTWSLPPEVNGQDSQVAMVMPYSTHVDGKIWTNNVGPRTIQRLDVNTGEWDTIDPYATWTRDALSHNNYGINADAQNNLYVHDIEQNLIVRIDAKTLEVKFYETPTPASGPRRGRMDSQYRLWVALSDVDKIAMLDPKTERFQEWEVPTPFTQTYDVMPDKYGDVWMGGMTSDFIYRLDPKTSQYTQYLLPKVNTNVRRVDVDDSTKPPVFWVGDDQSPTIYRLELFD